MSISIRLRVKFRAFGFTFGSIDKAWTVSPLGLTEISPSNEENSKVLYNDRGVYLSYWGLGGE